MCCILKKSKYEKMVLLILGIISLVIYMYRKYISGSVASTIRLPFEASLGRRLQNTKHPSHFKHPGVVCQGNFNRKANRLGGRELTVFSDICNTISYATGSRGRGKGRGRNRYIEEESETSSVSPTGESASPGYVHDLVDQVAPGETGDDLGGVSVVVGQPHPAGTSDWYIHVPEGWNPPANFHRPTTAEMIGEFHDRSRIHKRKDGIYDVKPGWRDLPGSTGSGRRLTFPFKLPFF